MDWMIYIVASFFALAGLGCVFLVAINLPGTWLMIALAALIELVDGLYRTNEPPVTFGWWLIGLVILIALIGELIEFLAGAAGARFGGGTRRGMIGAIVGGLVGAILFTPLVPIPLLGTLIGAIVGTFAGAFFGEFTHVQKLGVWRSLRPATGATIGRVVGSIAKTAIAGVIWLALSVAAFWP